MVKVPDLSADEIKKIYYSSTRSEILEFIPPGCKTILEVGCGEGNFALMVKKQTGAEVWGVELFPEAAEKALQKLDHVITGDFEQLIPELPGRYFDCIIFNDVLEHFPYPDRVLDGCKILLKNGGYILSSIPNVRYIGTLVELLLKKDWQYKSSGVLDYTHLRFFTRKSIMRMFSSAGYEVIFCQGRNPSRTLNIFILRCLTFGYYSDVRFPGFITLVKVH